MSARSWSKAVSLLFYKASNHFAHILLPGEGGPLLLTFATKSRLLEDHVDMPNMAASAPGRILQCRSNGCPGRSWSQGDVSELEQYFQGGQISRVALQPCKGDGTGR